MLSSAVYYVCKHHFQKWIFSFTAIVVDHGLKTSLRSAIVTSCAVVTRKHKPKTHRMTFSPKRSAWYTGVAAALSVLHQIK